MTSAVILPDKLADRALAARHVASWREQGFCFVEGLLPDELFVRARTEADGLFPAAGSPEAEAVTDFGSGGRMSFPSRSPAHNELTLHPRLLAAVAALLDCTVPDLRLTQSELWAKYGRRARSGGEYDNADQRIHVDYPNHTLLHPPRWDAPEAVEILVYADRWEEAGGATALVPRRGPDDPAYPWPIVATPGVGALPWINDRETAEAWLREHEPALARWREENLYAREREARYGLGSVLLYRHDLWHRGTPLRRGARRLAFNLTFRRADAEWISVLQPGWAWAMYRRDRVMETLIARASVKQRCVLGFPAPGHAFWNADTLAAVAARYGPLGFDARPYETALGVRSGPAGLLQST